MGLYVALSLFCGLYLLNLYRLPHDTPSDHIGVPRMLMSLCFIALSVYLVPALFAVYNPEGDKQRPSGAVFAWLDSFLLPDVSRDLPWGPDLEKGLKEAGEKGRLVFVDFTGVTCTNCKINEANIFAKREYKELLKRYTLVQLFTDKVPTEMYPSSESGKLTLARQIDDAGKNLAFQREKFNTEQLPLYVILRPTGKGQYQEVARYDEGKINNEEAFAQFLRVPLTSQVAQK